MHNLVKVELGCGTSKIDGYIGIDRYAFPEVDIVTDLNKGIPLEDNSVDIVYCSHSLEHLENLSNIITEIWRVCKHKAIVYVLSPYHMESVNLANFYHKQVFNESTFRFFTNDSKTAIDIKDYYNPHASSWGLSTSDNSIHSINLHTLNIEYFYFPSYMELSENEKRNARKSLLNVCDQIYYSLAVNKSGVQFTDSEECELKETARYHEVPIIGIIRNRKFDKTLGSSILDDIKKWDDLILSKLEKVNKELMNKTDTVRDGVNRLEQNINQKLYQCENTLYEKIKQNELEKLNVYIEDTNKKLIKANIDNFESLLKLEEKIDEKVNYLLEKLDTTTKEKNSLVAILQNQIKSNERNFIIKKYFFLFNRKHDIYEKIMSDNINFIDGLIINKNLKKTSILIMSDTVPSDNYFEYKIIGYGNRINFFLFSNIGAKLFVEVVLYGKIVKQKVFTISYNGIYTILLGEYIHGEGYIRFKILDNISIVRLLEIATNKWGFFTRRHLAGYIEQGE